MANLIFYDQVTCLVEEGKAVDAVYLDFSKASDIVSNAILLVSWQPTAWMGALFTG